MKMAVEQIRRQIPTEEFDYQALSDCLKDYARPRDRISDLIKSGVIVRVKKGLYIFGSDYSRGPYSRELLANLMYGPSYVSLDYALGYYALIPERVENRDLRHLREEPLFSDAGGPFHLLGSSP